MPGTTPWLSWSGPSELLGLARLDRNGALQGLPSAEPEMKDARPLLSLPATPAQGARLLAATPSDALLPLEVYRCALD